MSPPVITADSPAGRTLLALRAGPMTTEELNERFGSGNAAPALLRQGLAQVAGGYYRLTEAGRAACPYRNPLAAPKNSGAAPQGTQDMPREDCITRQEILNAIQAAGPAGITRKQLVEQFDGAAQNVDNHISNLYKAGTIVKPEKGLLVAANFPRPAGASAEMVVLPATSKPQPAPASAQADSAPSAVVLAEAEVDLREPGPQTVMHPGEPSLTPESIALLKKLADQPGPLMKTPEAPVFVPIHNTEGLEFGVFSTGSMTICNDDMMIELSREVVRELRSFLGLFQGEPA